MPTRYSTMIQATQDPRSIVCAWDGEDAVAYYEGDELPQSIPEEFPVLVVSARQIRLALRQLALRTVVEAWVAQSGDPVLQDTWEYSSEFYSNHPFAEAAGVALGKSPEEVYAVFQLAAGL